MKIEFKNKLKGNDKNTSIEDVKKSIVAFLENNGMYYFADDYVTIDNNRLHFKFDCSNNEYIKSIGLFTLLISRFKWSDETFISFRKGLMILNIGAKKRELIEYIEGNMNVTITK